MIKITQYLVGVVTKGAKGFDDCQFKMLEPRSGELKSFTGQQVKEALLKGMIIENFAFVVDGDSKTVSASIKEYAVDDEEKLYKLLTVIEIDTTGTLYAVANGAGKIFYLSKESLLKMCYKCGYRLTNIDFTNTNGRVEAKIRTA